MQLPFQIFQVYDFEIKFFGIPLCFDEKSGLVFFLDIVSIGEKAKEVNAITGQINPS